MEALAEFMSNIDTTQQRDHADRYLITQYQTLADAKATSDARARAAEKRSSASQAPPPEDTASDKAPERTTTPVGGGVGVGFFYRTPSSPKVATLASPSSTTDTASTLTLRQQLADAQRARTTLETANSQIPNLLATQNAQTRQLSVQEKELALLKRKLRDREEELKEKHKLASDVQDEMISLNLQLSVAEQKAERLEGENKGLVERWMREMGGRAEKMNRDMGFGGEGSQEGR